MSEKTENVGLDPSEPLPGEKMGAYEVGEFIARGGMASVMSATDTRSGDRCAIKLLLAVAHDEEARTRFRREFRALSRLDHPNVLRVYEWGLRGNRPWYSMELVTGRDLRSEVESWKKYSPEDRFGRVQGILAQVARALAYIHDRGLIHRDITPGNIMVQTDGTVKLMDFGVVKDLGTELTVAGSMVGTVAYISPEQIEGEHIDARADLYSLGTVLYLMLTGRRPFSARTLQGFLEKHLKEIPRSPAELEPMVPPHLNEICMRLLAKDPADRYASAVHLLHVLGDESGLTRKGNRWPPHSVGRIPIRDRIREVLNTLHSDQKGGAIYLSGEPGQGKSRLLSIAGSYAQRYGLPVIRGKCRPHDRPFGAFHPVFDAFEEHAPPILRHTFSGTENNQIRERYPVISAFKELIVQNTPCVILIDDLEHADKATLELLEYLIRNTLELADQPVTFIIAEETNSPVETPIARRLIQSGPVEWFHLGPLARAEVEELVLSIVPNTAASRALGRRLHDEGIGSPAFIADTLRGLIDEGVIRPDTNERLTLNLDASEITRSKLPIPASLRDALKERIAPLSEDALQVGRWVAVARRTLNLEVLESLVTLSEDELMDALDELVEANIVHEQRTEDLEQVELSHKRFRDVLIEELETDALKAKHQRLGEVLERHYRHRLNDVVEQLTHHFEQADLASKAYAYLCQTAQRHLMTSSWEVALSNIERALRMEPTARAYMLLNEADERLAQTLLSRSKCLHSIGQWDRSVKDAYRAYELASQTPNVRLQSAIAARLGRHLRDSGDLKASENFLFEALAKADEVGDASLRPDPLYQLGAIMWGKGDLEQSEKLWLQSLSNAQAAGDDRATGKGYNGLGILSICKGKTMEARRHLEQSARLFERVGLVEPLAIARVNLAELYHNTGILKKALHMTEKTIAQSREVLHPLGLALGLAHRAHLIGDLGRTDEALQNAQEALRIAVEINSKEDQLIILVTLIRIYARVRKLEQAANCIEQIQPLLERYDHEGGAPEVYAWAAYTCAGLGQLEEAHEYLVKVNNNQPQWPHIQVRTMVALGQAQIEMELHEDALASLQHTLQMAENNGFRYYQLIAHHHLCRVSTDPEQHAKHKRVAIALSRSLSANLEPKDSKSFLARGWGTFD